MTHKTNLPQPLDDTTLSPQILIPEAERLVAVYLRTLTSPQTIKTYNTELTLFISFLEDKMGKGLGGLTAEDISLYREHLIGVYAAATAAKKLAVLRRFLIFTYMAGATRVSAFFRQESARKPGPGLQRADRG
jgi:integrase/recombinase XerD